MTIIEIIQQNLNYIPTWFIVVVGAICAISLFLIILDKKEEP